VGFEGKLTKGAYLYAESVSGDLTVRAATEGSMDYEVSTFSGDITNCMGKEAERVSKYGPGRRLNGTRGAPGSDEAKVRLKTMSGDVELVTRLERWPGRGPPPAFEPADFRMFCPHYPGESAGIGVQCGQICAV